MERAAVETPELRVARDDVWCWTWRNCLFMCWSGVTPAGLAAASAQTTALRRAHPDVVTVSATVPGFTMPGAGERLLTLQMLSAKADEVRASAVLIEGDNIAERAVRNFLAAIILVAARSHTSFKVFKTADDAAAWLTPWLQPPGPDLAHAFRQARAQHRG